jgi:hypothetical protein
VVVDQSDHESARRAIGLECGGSDLRHNTVTRAVAVFTNCACAIRVRRVQAEGVTAIERCAGTDVLERRAGQLPNLTRKPERDILRGSVTGRHEQYGKDCDRQ